VRMSIAMSISNLFRFRVRGSRVAAPDVKALRFCAICLQIPGAVCSLVKKAGSFKYGGGIYLARRIEQCILLDLSRGDIWIFL
jgi:hypothetical protein